MERDGAGAAGDDPSRDLLRVVDPAGDSLRLVFAVAGLGPDQLEIFVTGDQITVSGEGTGDGTPGRFLHRGIAARRFRRAFRLASGLDVVAAELDRGLSSIALSPGGADRISRNVAIRPRSF
jgi:HSP20 family molecular chaperone IbpA